MRSLVSGEAEGLVWGWAWSSTKGLVVIKRSADEKSEIEG